MPVRQPLTPDPRALTIGVIVGRDQVGDALIKLPFLRALRNGFPEAKIYWITSQGPTAFGGVLREATRSLIDTVEERPVWVTSGDPSLSPFFDILIDTRNRWRMARAAKQIPHRIFLAPALRYAFSDQHPPLPDIFWQRPPHLVDRLLQLVELAAGFKPVSTGALPVEPDLVKLAQEILPPGKTYVGIAPGAGYAIKIWPRYKFERLAQTIEAKGRVPVFILGPQELTWYDELSANIPSAIFPLQASGIWGNTPLDIQHTMAVCSLLTCAIANDSGIGHMLAAVDCPLVSLFGPTSPDKLAPRVSRGIIVRAQTFGGNHMDAIPVEVAAGAVDQLLQS